MGFLDVFALAEEVFANLAFAAPLQLALRPQALALLCPCLFCLLKELDAVESSVRVPLLAPLPLAWLLVVESSVLLALPEPSPLASLPLCPLLVRVLLELGRCRFSSK